MKEEKRVPELRFSEFKDEWEETNLGKITKITMGQSPKSKTYNKEGEGLPLIQGNADINHRETLVNLYTSEPTKTVKKGDLVLTVRAPVGHVARVKLDSCIGRGVCGIESDNIDFIYYYLIKKEIYWNKYAQGSTFQAINSKDINDFNIKVPKSDIEQQKIGNFFYSLDQKNRPTKSEN